MRLITLSFVLLINSFGYAKPNCFLNVSLPLSYVIEGPMDWKVGQQTTHQATLTDSTGSQLVYYFEETVKSDVQEGLWVQTIQSSDYEEQKDVFDILYDKKTGQVLKYIINGVNCSIPRKEKYRVLETHSENVTVKAGAFESTYTKAEARSTGFMFENWISPKIPMTGVVKSKSFETEFKIPVEVELLSFKM
ncbi:MAG: hypothetical protein SGJ18_08310 [Pseudomonadota bacterium]|nr:hypothetical protein [Pseudomonadota bacterium]